MSAVELLSDLQCNGLKWEGEVGLARKGGAGPSDHKALSLNGQTMMIPVLNLAAQDSPYTAQQDKESDNVIVFKNKIPVATLTAPKRPKFYDLKTADGIPYEQIATLHSHDVLATTVLQHCIRMNDKATACQFCSIDQSLKDGRTLIRKRPEQLAEVAKAAVELDGITQMILTTGTPSTSDRGAEILFDSVTAIRAVVDLPIQVQCEPPDDFSWFAKLKNAGAVSIGMHLEAVSDRVRHKIMPGKAEVSLDKYFAAFKAAVEVFGRGQVSTYILAGLGDTREEILDMTAKLTEIGVYPFVVPFVPIHGTPLEHHSKPEPEFMQALYPEIGAQLKQHKLKSEDTQAGCAKCGACSSLKAYE
ncbi:MULTISPECIES: MSMEG_0568 family radical SAM protein [Acinetobacter]|uniref:MSMEG_0568 family radical SAM protein n=1 Tax=Acinetobacter TaxID=469 RepID=UPI000CDDEB85|nr:MULTISPECIES: MSMEG_0568 family radical SAM protein [Acinetobacter]MCU4322423.1 MSMEG_0568 family radical SAM protein [Acinetobacter schindleri]POU25194.1 MSMEG_0568 family radical SAM protein [Acinetobacter sp. ACNIH3]POV78909.1 MSMEG_0568 family radical SAM protein [Acinetobacter sp. ACNIH4]